MPHPLPLDSVVILRRMIAYLLIVAMIGAAAVLAIRAWRQRQRRRPRRRHRRRR